MPDRYKNLTDHPLQAEEEAIPAPASREAKHRKLLKRMPSRFPTSQRYRQTDGPMNGDSSLLPKSRSRHHGGVCHWSSSSTTVSHFTARKDIHAVTTRNGGEIFDRRNHWNWILIAHAIAGSRPRLLRCPHAQTTFEFLSAQVSCRR